VLGAREVFDFGARQGLRPLRFAGYAAALLVPVATLQWSGAPQRWSWPWLLYGAALWLLLVMVWAAARGPEARPLGSVAVTLFGVAYAAALPAFAIALRHRLGTGARDEPLAGTLLLLFPLALTWIGDTAAMAGGKGIGGPKLAPTLSPGKTWAGALCGLAGTLLSAAAFAAWAFPRANITVAMVWALVMGAVISVAGQVGDVAESVFKRELGVKDSSALIPGHGGVLDRFDALYFVLPVTAVLYDVFLPTVR
jgi:phosphatidate cytidylyltransferase